MQTLTLKSIGYVCSAASVCLLAYAASIDHGALQNVELFLSVCLPLTGMALRWVADVRSDQARRLAAQARAPRAEPVSTAHRRDEFVSRPTAAE